MITAETEAALAALEGRPMWAVVHGKRQAFGILQAPCPFDVWTVLDEETGHTFGFLARMVTAWTTIDGYPAAMLGAS